MKKYLFLFLAICISQLMALNVSASSLDVVAYHTATDVSDNVYVTGGFCSPFITFGTFTLTNQTTMPGYYGDMFIVKYNASGTVQWAGSAGGSKSESGSSIATDVLGNVYVTGTFNSPSITFFGTTSYKITLYNTGRLGDMFIVKYNANGIVKWAKKAGGSDEDEGVGIATDVSGNVYVTGGFWSPSITFGKQTGTITLTNAGIGNGDMFIVQYDPNGYAVWAKSAGGSGNDYGNSIATDGSGDVYVTGRFSSSSITFGNTTLYNAGTSSQDMFVVKYDASGTVFWATSAGGTGGDLDGGVAIGAGGDVYVTGSFSSPSIAFGNNITLTNADNSGYINKVDMFIVKYGTDGKAVWAKNAVGRSNGWGIATHGSEGSENVFVTGSFNSSSITFGTTTLKNSGSADIFIVKYDASGNVLWAKSAGGTGGDIAWSIATDGSGNAFVTGSFTSTSITFGTITLSNTNNCGDMFIAKYDADGNVPWAKCVGGTISNPGHPKSTNEGINEALTNEINIYPNPTSGMVILSTTNSQSPISRISVFNMIGKEVLIPQFIAGSSEVTVDLSSQPKGLYIVLIKTGENFYSRKIIVE